MLFRSHLITAFVLGNFLSNLASPYSGAWELIFMPFVNLVGASVCYLVGQRWAYAGAALYALLIGGAVSLMLSVLTDLPFVGLFPGLLASEGILIIGGVPLMRTVLRAAEPARRRWRAT